MAKKVLKNKRKYIILLGVFLIVILIYCIYNFVLNPRDLLGNRCKTFYNQSQYKLVNGDVIDIPDNSCFVSECCQYSASFRSKKNIDELRSELDNLEAELNAKNDDLEFEISVNEEKFFNTFTINYH